MGHLRLPAIAVLAVALGLATFGLATGQPKEDAEKPAAAPESVDYAALRAELGRSLEQRATAALMTGKPGDRIEAAHLYREWLRANPQDERSWYNLACIWALAGDADRAFAALDNAIATGYGDARHVENDPDFESLREDPRFALRLKAIADVSARAAREKFPAGWTYHRTRQIRYGTYAVMPPPGYDSESGTKLPVCVILHGHGSTEFGHGTLADELGREGILWVAVRAPYPFRPLMLAGRESYTGWTGEEGTGEAWEKALSPAEHPSTLYADWILACVDDVARRYPGADTRRVHLLGHSQGAHLSMYTALVHPDRVATAACYAGLADVDGRLVTEERLKRAKEAGIAFLLLHGTADKVWPSRASSEWAEKVAPIGLDLTFTLLEDVDHRIRPPAMEALRKWVAEKVRKAPAGD
jgi:predicted esterase